MNRHADRDPARRSSAAVPPFTPRSDGRPTVYEMRERANKVSRLRSNDIRSAPGWEIRSWRSDHVVYIFQGRKAKARQAQLVSFLEELYGEDADEAERAERAADSQGNGDGVDEMERGTDSDSDAESESDVLVHDSGVLGAESIGAPAQVDH